MDNKEKAGVAIYVSVVAILAGLCIFFAVNCSSADAKLASQKLNCGVFSDSEQASKLSLAQQQTLATLCCAKFMSSGTGSDSKDAFCQPIAIRAAESFDRWERVALYKFCFEQQVQIKDPADPNKFIMVARQNAKDGCWDKVKK